jgi:hypothetical protein
MERLAGWLAGEVCIFHLGLSKDRPLPKPSLHLLGQTQKQRVLEVCLLREQKIEETVQDLFSPLEKCAKKVRGVRNVQKKFVGSWRARRPKPRSLAQQYEPTPTPSSSPQPQGLFFFFFSRFGLQEGNVVVSIHKYLLLTDLYLWRFRTKTV